MLTFLFKLFFIQATPFPSNIYKENQIILKFINAFAYEKTMQNWIDLKKATELEHLDFYKEIICKIRNVLLEINDRNNKDLKNLIMETNITLDKLGNPYYETYVVIKSVQRIIEISNIQNEADEESITNFGELLYKEYDGIFIDMKTTIISVGYEFNKTETLEYLKGLFFNGKEHVYNLFSLNDNPLTTKNLINSTNNMIDLILPIKTSTIVQVNASFLGFCSSTKCYINVLSHIFGKKYTSICTKEMSQYRMNCSTEQTLINQIDLAIFMDKIFICNKTTAKILIILFHFYSEIREKNTTYELKLTNKNEYMIKWRLNKIQPKEEIKNNWLRKVIFNVPTRRVIDKFSFLYDYQIEYSTIESDETKGEPINTRLILLSCGHQLGLELIDEFCEYFLSRDIEPATCYICRVPIWIVGSYDGIVYRCRFDNNIDSKKK